MFVVIYYTSNLKIKIIFFRNDAFFKRLFNHLLRTNNKALTIDFQFKFIRIMTMLTSYILLLTASNNCSYSRSKHVYHDNNST